jgi:hypothetical protein
MKEPCGRLPAEQNKFVIISIAPVEELDPIKQLQSLLDDRGKVLEKISGIQSALSSLKTSASVTHALPSASTTEAQPDFARYAIANRRTSATASTRDGSDRTNQFA